MWSCIISLVPHIWHQVSLTAQPIVLFVVNTNFGKYKIFHRPYEALLLVVVKAFLHLKITLLFRTTRDFNLLTYKAEVYTHQGVFFYSI